MHAHFDIFINSKTLASIVQYNLMKGKISFKISFIKHSYAMTNTIGKMLVKLIRR